MRAWCNGQLIDPQAPALSVLDHVVTVGDGVFEVVKIVDNQPFAMTRHLARLVRSAVGLGLPEPDLDEIGHAVKATLADQDIPYGLVRITYTAGISPLGSNRLTQSPTLIAVAKPEAPRPRRTSAVTVPWPRNERGPLAGLKTTSYAENVVALAYAAERDATEAIFANTVGNLCEGTGSNVFCVFGRRIITPPLSAGCLAGITRDLVVEWCDVEERDISMKEYDEADEVFLASTTRDVQAVDLLDGKPRGGTSEVAMAVADEWARREKLDCDP